MTRFAIASHKQMGVLAALAAAGIWLVALSLAPDMGLFWGYGLAFGFVLQRSRFCFASSLRDIFLLQDGHNFKGVLAGLAVATVGFGLIMSKQIPNPTLGFLPPSANVLPIGLHLIAGGLIFGVGMVIAGGCVSGSVYRMGEGYLASWASFGGILLGVGATAYTWNWWWDFSIANGPRIWLPAYLGHGGAIAVTLLALLALYVAVVWWERRNGTISLPHRAPSSAGDGLGAHLRADLARVFVQGWPVVLGGVALGALNIMLFYTEHPWGFTGELSRWMIGLTTALGIGPGELLGASSLPGCTLEVADAGEGGMAALFHHMLFLVWGMVMGSHIGALFAGEFKIRRPRQKRRYWQASGGGLLMGVGATLAMGCTIGAFFSAIPSLALNGWVFLLALAAGAWLGVRILQRIE